MTATDKTMSGNKDLFLSVFNSIDFEKIKDHPNILIAANFWDEERYQAAKTCYKFMRAIDDMIDDYKAEHIVISDDDVTLFEERVADWLRTITLSQTPESDQRELVSVFTRFRLPLWTMQDFARSMIYDIHHDGFQTLQAFLDYAGGASVAPASVFVHLAGIRSDGDSFQDPLFDVRTAALPCAVFSYLVHIVRDFQKDQFNNLTYFADDRIIANGLSREILADIAHGGGIPDGFRDLISEYLELAAIYRDKTYDKIKEISPLVGPRYRLSLEIIFELYKMVYERIDVRNGLFTTKELNPTPSETRERVYEVIMRFNG